MYKTISRYKKYEGFPAVECLIFSSTLQKYVQKQKYVQNARKFVEIWHSIILHGILVVQQLQ